MNTKKIEMCDLLEKNCMDYAKYTITDRAIIDLRDGCKPIHKRILWSMFIDGLTHTKHRTKSVNAVGSVLRFSPHGDSSVYQACVRLTNDSVNYPIIDGKGSFGSTGSKDIQPGASRYTEMRLALISQEYLKDINKNVVNMVGNYDNTRLEPEVLPTTFPVVLCQPNIGIAVGISSNICPFDMGDVIGNTINLINNKETSIMIPTFSTGGKIIYNEKILKQLKETGVGTVKLRAKYHIEKDSIVIQIPYTTTRESIINVVINLVKDKKIKEIIDINDYSGKEGLNITIDIKKNTNIDVLMSKLFKRTPLEDAFSCNFTVLNKKKPMTLGTDEILKQWIDFRRECTKRGLEYDLISKKEKLHLSNALEKILLDIDRTIEVIRYSEEDDVTNLLKEMFSIDDIQAEYISNLKLRNINQKYILKQIKEIDSLKNEIKILEYKINTSSEIDKIIIADLKRVKKEYSQPRRTEVIYEDTMQEISKEDLLEDYSCNIIYTKENYLKKTLRYSEQQKFKDDDEIISMVQVTNKGEVLVITDKQNAHKIQINDLDNKQPSSIGDYIPNLLKLEKDENIIGCAATSDYNGYLVITYESGKIHKLPLESFKTSTKRTMLKNTTVNEKIISIIQIEEDADIYLESSQDKAMIINTVNINSKASRSANGIQIMSSNKDDFRVIRSELYKEQVDREIYVTTKKSAGLKLGVLDEK